MSDDWLSTVVRAEHQWSERGSPFLGLDFPQMLSLIHPPVFAYNVSVVYKRRPLATAATMGLKLWFVAELVQRYDP